MHTVWATQQSVGGRGGVVANVAVKTGRPWTYLELSVKDFTELHQLYWVCVKERNRIATAENERKRMHAGYGAFEHTSRMTTVSFAFIPIFPAMLSSCDDPILSLADMSHQRARLSSWS